MGKDTRETVIGVITVGALDATLRGEAVAAVDTIFAVEQPVGIQERFRVITAAG